MKSYKRNIKNKDWAKSISKKMMPMLLCPLRKTCVNRGKGDCWA